MASPGTNATLELRPPVVGVLCIDIARSLRVQGETDARSYIAASYVKYLEAAGARIVPVWLARNRSYYKEIMSKINGVLIPGGAVFFDPSDITDPDLRNDCVESAGHIYALALEMNAAGNHFPVWGTCLGFELLMYHSTGDRDIRQECTSMRCSLPLELEADFRDSRMFAQLSSGLEELLRREPFGHHLHRFCVTKHHLLAKDTGPEWRVLATNVDPKSHLRFISLIEHKKYPIYGCQFHPERVCYEYPAENGAPNAFTHSPAGITAAHYFATFFIDQCRRSPNRFPSVDNELDHLIWNFPVTYTKTHWMQVYIFGDSPAYKVSQETEPI